MLQHELSKHVVLKYTPRLHFHLDTSVERGTKIMEIMRHVDEVTPPESAEDAARRTDALRGRRHRGHRRPYSCRNSTRTSTPEEAEEADEAEAEEDDKARSGNQESPHRQRIPRAAASWHEVTRGKPDGTAADDDE